MYFLYKFRTMVSNPPREECLLRGISYLSTKLKPLDSSEWEGDWTFGLGVGPGTRLMESVIPAWLF